MFTRGLWLFDPNPKPLSTPGCHHFPPACLKYQAKPEALKGKAARELQSLADGQAEANCRVLFGTGTMGFT